jgi:hypothetical protein
VRQIELPKLTQRHRFDLYTIYAGLLVLRQDFGYQRDNPFQVDDDILAQHHEAKNDHERFLNAMENNSLG